MKRENFQPENAVDYSRPGLRGIQKCQNNGGRMVSACLFAMVLIFSAVAFADDREDHGDDHHKHKSHESHESKCNGHDPADHADAKAAPVANPDYAAECGVCHMAYPPGLLPSASWQKITDDLDNHFGESVAVDAKSQKSIRQYLESNAADHSGTEVSVKIMRGLGGQIPERITELPYIVKKHHDIAPSVLKRPAIGSLSNCAACHKGAANSDFEDDAVVVPN